MTHLIRFESPLCPDCGQRASGTVEIIKAVAQLQFASPDAASYTATTTYGEQYTLARGPHQVELTCSEGHEWPLGSGLAPVGDDLARPHQGRLSSLCRRLLQFLAARRRPQTRSPFVF